MLMKNSSFMLLLPLRALRAYEKIRHTFVVIFCDLNANLNLPAYVVPSWLHDLQQQPNELSVKHDLLQCETTHLARIAIF